MFKNRIFFLITGLLRLPEQEPQVVLRQHRHLPLLPVHRQSPRHGRAHLLCEIPQNGQVEAEGAQADGVRRQQTCQGFL